MKGTAVAKRLCIFERRNKVQINPSINSHDAIQCIADRSPDRTIPLLTTLSSMKFKPFEEVFRWFSEELKVIYPDSFLVSYDLDVGGNGSWNSLLSEVLKNTDTGISALVSTPVSESALRLSPYERNELLFNCLLSRKPTHPKNQRRTDIGTLQRRRF